MAEVAGSGELGSRWVAESARVWLWYATLELALAAAQEHAHLADGAHTFDWRLELAVAAAYALVGVAVGAALTLAFRIRVREALARRALLALPLMAALAAQLAGTSRASAVGLASLAIVAVAAIAGRVPRAASGWLHPLCVSGVALAPQLADVLAPGRQPRALASAAIAAAVLVVSALAPRIRSPRLLRLATLPACLAAAIVSAQRMAPAIPVAGSAEGLNVVLVVLDTTRADHLSLYGYARGTTPYLARLAAESLVFERAYSASDLTLSSHASLFTGVPARVHGARADGASAHGWQRLGPELPTLAESFRARGYGTYAVVGNAAMLNRNTGVTRGFEYLDSRHGPAVDVGKRELLRSRLAPLIDALRRAPQYRRAEDILGSAGDVLDVAAPGRFFLFVNLMDSHAPYLPPEPFASRFGGARRVVDTLGTAWSELRDDVNAGRRTLGEEELAFLISQYDGAIAYQDAQLEPFIERLRRAGLLERTVLVVTADHGEAIGDHGTLTHGVSVYDEQVHVPLMIRAPGLAPGRVAKPISLTGLGDVLRALASGRAAAAEVAAAQAEPVVAESYPDPGLVALSPRFAVPVRAAVVGDSKVIEREGGTPQLFALESDPRELAPLPAPPSAQRLIPTWLAAHPLGRGAPLRVDAETSEELRALGYVVPAEPAHEAERARPAAP